ncbi:hypothetical protein ACUWCL_28540, partial [Klebsiella pneumoniae]|uniref:hypothetical protein n=1 Tax=Klebsiella pneumoniae TaxID=573 RepID=UPI0040559BD6
KEILLTGVAKDRRHVIVGDLNANHSWWSGTRANALGRYITKTPYTVIHPGLPTFRHFANPDRTSTPDLLLTQQPHRVTGFFLG